MATILYGIPNCDTVRKARKWLDQHDIDYTFHDLRKDGLTTQHITGWAKAVGYDTLINRRGTTWRQMDDSTQQKLSTSPSASALVEHPTLIKRPVLQTGKHIEVGFKPEQYNLLF